MSKRIAMVFPYAPLYREPIYLMMDKTFDIDWYFCGNSDHSLKKMDYSTFKSVDTSMKEQLFKGYSFWYEGLTSLPLSKYDYLVIPGQTHCLAEWYLAMKYGHKLKGPKVYFWSHGWYGKETKIQKMLKKIYYSYADGMFVYGDRAKNLMIKEGYSAEKLHPIHNSLDYDKQIVIRESLSANGIYSKHFGNDNPVLLFIGRLTEVKQLGLLVEAVGELAKKGHNYNLVFVGDGEERLTLQEQVSAYGLLQHVWFYGECYDENINAELIYNADLCVSPGNIGLTAIHSLVFGTPCLTHNKFECQMPESEAIKDGETGCFFKYRDVDSLMDSIQKWFEKNKGRRDEVRKSCYKIIDAQWNPYYQINVLKSQLK